MRNFRPRPAQIPNIIKVGHTVPRYAPDKKPWTADGGRRTPHAARRTDIWITKSLPELSSDETTIMTNITKFAVLEPKFTHNFRSKASNFAKIQFFKPDFFPKFSSLSFIFLGVPTRSLSYLRPFGPHIYTKMKVEYPPECA